MQIDWTKAPKWAQYHAFNYDGSGKYFARKPRTSGIYYWHYPGGGIASSGLMLPANQDWEKSIVERCGAKDNETN